MTLNDLERRNDRPPTRTISEVAEVVVDYNRFNNSTSHTVRHTMVNTHHLLCHLCAKSTSKISCRMMKIAPPAIPIYIQARPHNSDCHIYQTKSSNYPVNTYHYPRQPSVSKHVNTIQEADLQICKDIPRLQLYKLFPKKLQTTRKIFNDVSATAVGILE